ncbi:VanZ-like family protein [Ahrensia sp. R2A130]|nr:VanZ-like family protein [Ahrensia sp. R2A130]
MTVMTEPTVPPSYPGGNGGREVLHSIAKSNRKWRWARYIAIIVTFSVLLYFGLAAKFFPEFDPTEQLRGRGDQNLHILAFAVLTFLIAVGRHRYLPAIAFCVLAAILVESLQMYLPSRSADPNDLWASIKGVGIGFLVALAVNIVIVSNRDGMSVERRRS